MKTNHSPSHKFHDRFPASNVLNLSAALLAVGFMPVFAGPSNNSDSRENASMTSSAATRDNSVSRSDTRFLQEASHGNEREIALAQLAASKASDPQVRDFAQTLANDHRAIQNALQQLAVRKNVALTDAKAMSMDSTTERSMAKPGSLATYQDHNVPSVAGDPAMAVNTGTGSQIASADHTAMDRELAARGSEAFTSQTPAEMTATNMTDTPWTDDRHYRKLNKESGAEFDRDFVKLMVDEHESDLADFKKEAKSADNADVRAFAADHAFTLQQHLDQARSLAASLK
jgi:predicted outer membrane protein